LLTLLILAQIALIPFEIVLSLIVFSNSRRLRRLNDYPEPAVWPSLSVLVPARNEAHNIRPCVESLLAQNYPCFELLVLDDSSTDETQAILADLAVQHPQLRVLSGQPLRPDWLGKHWACHQLAQAATADLLLFTDADTRYQPHALRAGVAAMLAEEADLLTALPRQEVGSWFERLVVPLIPWSIFTFIPLWLAYRWQLPILSATIGQFMLFRRSTYEAIGGYQAVRQDVVDDLALGRRVKAWGGRWRLANADGAVHCRMYHHAREVYEGISKNLYAAFAYSLPFFCFVWLWLGVVFWTPFLVLGLSLVGFPLPFYLDKLALFSIVGALYMWGATYRCFKIPTYLTLFYPITIFLAVMLAGRSLILTLTGRATWKGRQLPRRNVV
jgi:chlorobactene glucosyltransferase